MEQERKELLRRWLRGKGFHPTDIGYALARCEQEIETGHDVTDNQVAAYAEDAHSKAVDKYAGEIPEKVFEVKVQASFWGAFLGATNAIIVIEVIKWVLGMIL